MPAGVLLLVALLLAILLTKGSSPHSTPSRFDGAALPAGIQAPNFSLADQRGQSISLRSLRGQPVLIAFLYSTCGATCFVISQQIRGALDELSKPATVLFISANPAADTPARIRSFLSQASLAGRVLYLTGTTSQLKAVWHAYNITPASAGKQQFDKHASLLLLDSQGHERVLYGQEQLTPESLSHDIRLLQTP